MKKNLLNTQDPSSVEFLQATRKLVAQVSALLGQPVEGHFLVSRVMNRIETLYLVTTRWVHNQDGPTGELKSLLEAYRRECGVSGMQVEICEEVRAGYSQELQPVEGDQPDQEVLVTAKLPSWGDMPPFHVPTDSPLLGDQLFQQLLNGYHLLQGRYTELQNEHARLAAALVNEGVETVFRVTSRAMELKAQGVTAQTLGMGIGGYTAEARPHV